MRNVCYYLFLGFFFCILRTNISLAKELRTKIAILDSGISLEHFDYFKPYICENGLLDLTNTGINDDQNHGTTVTKLIVDQINSQKSCIIIIKTTTGKNLNRYYSEGLFHSYLLNVKYVNFSAGGYYPVLVEKLMIATLLKKGVRIVVAAGNNNINLAIEPDYYPACYGFKSSNFYVIGSVGNNKIISKFSNYNGPVTNYEPGEHYSVFNGVYQSGTSFSTAIFTGKLVHKEENK